MDVQLALAIPRSATLSVVKCNLPIGVYFLRINFHGLIVVILGGYQDIDKIGIDIRIIRWSFTNGYQPKGQSALAEAGACWE